MSCRNYEVGFVYFGKKIIEKLSSEGIKISEEIYRRLYTFLKNYATEINENFSNESFFDEIYSKVKKFFKT